MKVIEFKNPHRKKHFEFFKRMDQPHFSLCAPVDITTFIDVLKINQIPFTPSIVYCIGKTANQIAEFRQRIRGEQVVEHELVHPSFTVLTEVSDVFSFCTVNFQNDFPAFLQHALSVIEEMKQKPSFEDEEGRDDYLFLSSIPWVSFTQMNHAMHYSPSDSVPRIVWGKYYEENGKIKMPLSVQAHHALVDGRHMGQYFELFQSNLFEAQDWLEKLA